MGAVAAVNAAEGATEAAEAEATEEEHAEALIADAVRDGPPSASGGSGQVQQGRGGGA